MADMPWRDAIEKVLRDEGDALHYATIAELIVSNGLRKSVGATPADTVASVISTSLKDEGEVSPFQRVRRGEYTLRDVGQKAAAAADEAHDEDVGQEADTGPIQALGMYWERDLVRWTPRPAILGRQQIGADPVDMSGQLGVYLLHDVRGVVYVGRCTERPLGIRLYEHTCDRLKTRWSRFSWFGLSPVNESGRLGEVAGGYDALNIVTAMEALLIEALEPRQNRRRGDGFSGVEYIQAEDPEIGKAQMVALMDEFKKRMGG